MQSGMLPANMIMNDRSVPVSIVISAGNQAVLTIEDYIDVLLDDPAVTAIGLYIEGIKSVQKFADAAIKAINANKPVVVLKAGRSSLGSQISVSHTGSLSGTDEAFQALFDQFGMIRVESPVEMMETLKFLSVSGAPKGRRLAAFTCSGGDAAMVADYCARVGLELTQPSLATSENLAELLPDIATVSNPLDYTTPLWGNTEIMPKVFQTMIADDYDAAVVIQDFPRANIHADNTHYRNDAKSFMQACNELEIPGAVCSDLPENIDRESREIMMAGRITPLQGLDAGLDAIANACRYGIARSQILSADGPPAFDMIATPDADGAYRIVDEWQGKQRLYAAGLDIPVATGENLYTPADFTRFLRRDAVDIVQPDLRRGGGPTALLEIGAVARSFGRPYASHGGGPVQLNIMATLPNALYLETGLIPPDSPLVLEDGCAVVPEGPGFSWA